METSTPEKEEIALKKHSVGICSFVKKYRRILICIFVALLLCVAAIITVFAVRSKQAQNLLNAQIGRCYKEETYDTWSGRTTRIYYFTENGVVDLEVNYGFNKEERVEHVWGSLDETYQESPFKITFSGKPYLYGNRLIKLNENSEIIECRGVSWELISLEEALKFEEESRKLYAQNACEHEYGKLEVTAEATCSQNGKETKTCKKCGYVWVNKIDKLPHIYVNKICSVCGAEKKLEKSTISANTWYTYKDVLQVQNCLVKEAFSTGGGTSMMVQYNAVCQKCHAIEETSKLSAPEVGYVVERIHTCEECGAYTTVKLRID